MKVKIKFKSEYKNIKPICKIFSKSSSYEFEIDNNVFDEDFELQQEDVLNIEFLNKDGVDDNVVHIDEICIDDINIQHYIYDGEFFPEYDKDWLHKQSTTPPSSYKPCTELRLKGIWKLKIKIPIWKMMMEKWLQDER